MSDLEFVAAGVLIVALFALRTYVAIARHRLRRKLMILWLARPKA